jgi:hypothetical protein
MDIASKPTKIECVYVKEENDKCIEGEMQEFPE